MFQSHIYIFLSVLSRIAELASVMPPLGVVPCRPSQIFIDSFASTLI